MAVSMLEGGRSTLVSIRVPEAVKLDASRFRSCTTAAYAEIKSVLADRSDRHLIRMWNFIPDILAPLVPFPQRYMAFNAGRFEAYAGWFEAPDEGRRSVPTSSGVGHAGSDLVIHALTCDRPGIAVENVRQVPSYRYSTRYGPVPPCFSRATRLNGDVTRPAILLAGGTASVVGEETAHATDLEAQIEETFTNLASLSRSGLPELERLSCPANPLELFRFLRVYYARAEDRDPIARRVETGFAGLHDVEYLEATLCRPGLLVEIEGVASRRSLAEFAAVS
jgi:chorismatase